MVSSSSPTPEPAGAVARPTVAALAVATALFAIAAAGGAAPASAATTISSGHADLGARIAEGRLQIGVKSAGSAAWRRPSTVVFRVGPKAKVSVPSGDRKLVGAATAWVMPQGQKAGVPWLGWSTQALSADAAKGRVTWSLTGVSGPGRAAVFTTRSLGEHDVLFSSGRRPFGTRKLALGAHGHGNWSFSKAGTYRLTFRMAVRSRSGKVLSDRQALRVKVG